VLPPALNVARAAQNVSTPSATVASATSVALGSTESVSHSAGRRRTAPGAWRW
jgi:hypothetical protein